MTDINIGMLSESINDKMDRDYGNADYQTIKTDHANDSKPYLTDTYVSGTSGYRIWSDGYCEQWGTYLSSDKSTAITISLPKTYKDTNYNLIITTDSTTDNFPGELWILGWKSKSTNSFVTRTDNSNYTYAKSWKASGYIQTTTDSSSSSNDGNHGGPGDL